MAKTRKRSKTGEQSRIDWGGAAAKGTGRLNLVIGVVATIAVVALGALWWQSRGAEAELLELAAQGRAALERVEAVPDEGRGHLQSGEHRSYASAFPTSGRHSTTWTKPGVYDKPQLPTLLVHALEHGNVVVYYDEPGAEVMDRLESWAGLYGGQWDGLVLTPSPGLGPGVVLTAWRKVLRLESFDPAAAAAFIDEYRGRGPENPVR